MARTLTQTVAAAGDGVATFTSPTDEQVAAVEIVGAAAPNEVTSVEVVGDVTQSFPITEQGTTVRVSFPIGLLGATVRVVSPAGAAGALIALTWQWND